MKRFVSPLFWSLLSLLVPWSAVLGQNFTITATADGTINDATGDGIWDTVNTTGPGLTVRQFPGTVMDRSIAVFDLAAIPVSATVTSVSFTFRTVALTGTSNRPVSIQGYTGNGTITLSDATAASTFLATYDSAALGLGPQTISLGASGITVLNAARGAGGILELRLQAGIDGINTSVASIDSGFTPVPQLFVVTAVPEPATLAAVGAGLAALGGLVWRRHRRRALRADVPDPVDVE